MRIQVSITCQCVKAKPGPGPPKKGILLWIFAARNTTAAHKDGSLIAPEVEWAIKRKGVFNVNKFRGEKTPFFCLFRMLNKYMMEGGDIYSLSHRYTSQPKQSLNVEIKFQTINISLCPFSSSLFSSPRRVTAATNPHRNATIIYCQA